MQLHNKGERRPGSIQEWEMDHLYDMGEFTTWWYSRCKEIGETNWILELTPEVHGEGELRGWSRILNRT